MPRGGSQKAPHTRICTKKARVCEKVVELEPELLMYVPNRVKTVKMYEGAVEADPW